MIYYPFELHTHTLHSDGNMSPECLVEKALERGLKGIAVTDHNTTSAADEVYKLGLEKGLVVIKGIEWTTFYGHFTVLGGNSNIDWRKITPDNINEMISIAAASEDIVNIAHPKRTGSPICTGCYMEYSVDYSLITGYEVWSNDRPYFNPTNLNAMAEYKELLSKGYKLTCLYGDDWHGKNDNRKQYAITYLGINGEVNAHSAMEALRKHRTYISTGLKVNIVINNEKGSFMIGDSIGRGAIAIKAILDAGSDYCVKYGVRPSSITLKGSALTTVSYPVEGNDININNLKVNPGYFTIEIQGIIEDKEAVLLITSPVFVV